jgi:hypothetical protein
MAAGPSAPDGASIVISAFPPADITQTVMLSSCASNPMHLMRCSPSLVGYMVWRIPCFSTLGLFENWNYGHNNYRNDHDDHENDHDDHENDLMVDLKYIKQMYAL